MIYSVYSYPQKAFEYFEVDTEAPPTAWFRAPSGRPIPESLAVQLPPAARLVGTGARAQGIVAVKSTGVGALTPAGTPAGPGPGWFAGVLVGLGLGWWLARKR